MSTRRKPVSRWLTTTKAAEILGKSRATVWQWCRRGLIPEQYLMKVGNHTMVGRAFCEAGGAA